MAVYGIIAEYNPFHNGHLYQLNKIREFDNDAKIIVVMSGPFTQRGSLAILDKWQRAELAVKNGVDLVVELPAVFALRSAQFFAEGGVSLLRKMSVVNKLVFGTEADNLSELMSIVNLTSAPNFDVKLQEFLGKGLPYAVAVSDAIHSFDSQIPLDTVKSPNNILAVEYLKALKKNNSKIEPLAIKRKQAAHNDNTLHAEYASASAIRYAVKEKKKFSLKKVLPDEVYDLLNINSQAGDFPRSELLYRSFLLINGKMTADEVKNIYGINEGLENLIAEATAESQNLAELIDRMTTRRYPRSRIQRLVNYILLGWTKDAIEKFTAIGPQYIRVLAFNQHGQQLLHDIKKSSDLPVITKVSSHLNSHQMFNDNLTDLQQMLAFDIKAQNVYNLTFPDIKKGRNDWLISPRIL